MARGFRLVYVVLAALAVWLVALPASAAAPICDDRGASGFAPAPTLDTPNASVDIGMTPDPCAFHLERDVSFHQGRAPQPLPAPLGVDVMPVDVRVIVHAPPSALRLQDLDAEGSRLGVAGRLERPPRS
jgi:hypothetical protein